MSLPPQHSQTAPLAVARPLGDVTPANRGTNNRASGNSSNSVNSAFVNACWAYHMGERATVLDYAKDPVRGFHEAMGAYMGTIELFEVTPPGTIAVQLELAEQAGAHHEGGGSAHNTNNMPNLYGGGADGAASSAGGKIRRSDLIASPDGSAQGQYAFLINLRSPHLNPMARESIISSPSAFLSITAFLMSLSDVDQQARRHALLLQQSSQTGGDAGGGLPPITWKRCQAVVINGEGSPMAHLRAGALGRLVFITGTVMRMCTPKLVCVAMVYKCGQCGNTVSSRVEGGALEFPKTCAGRCKGFSFKPVPEEAEVEEVQNLKLQGNNQLPQAAGGQQGGAGGHQHMSQMGGGGGLMDAPPQQQDDVSQSVDVELRGILMDQSSPGDIVTVGGIVMARRGEKQFAGTHQICIRAISIVSHSMCKASGSKGARSVLQRMLASQAHITAGDGGGGGGGAEGISRGIADTSANSIARYYESTLREGWFERLVDSVCPGIYGHPSLKAAILLALVGGSDRNELSRPAIHLLMVGDPGLGKSQMLRAACLLSPRSAFVSANTSSTCGLTVSVSRDGGSGETTFEAGAVVHGDGGITCIDELDKGTNEHKALLEVMEQQSVSMAKAGMIFSMPIRTTVMAAGNPIGGKFDPYKTLCENINMTPALLSRFDIVHVMRDCDSTTADLTRHVLGVHVEGGAAARATGHQQRGGGAVGGGRSARDGPLSIQELSRFLAFAKKERQPVLSEEAAVLLKEAYMEKRKANRAMQQGADLPITPRHLQSLIRLSEAFAKIYLRTMVTAEDARRAIDLHATCSAFATPNPSGSSASQGAFAARSVSKAMQQKMNATDRILAAAKAKAASRPNKRVSHSELIEIIDEVGGVRNAEAKIKDMNMAGYFLSFGSWYGFRGLD